MTTRVDLHASFKKDLKPLARKYRAVVTELDDLITELEAGKRTGDKIPNVGYDVYKVRLANPSAGRGKRGGFRVVYYVKLADHVILLTIYSKTEQSDIPTQTIQTLIEEIANTQTGASDE
jgi:mRNA-degrading endonuclease RelE of RelBE toxin-antitoxin system